MGPELRLYTRCEEWSRCEPSSRINAGECISGGEEEVEAREHLASRRTHIGAPRRGGNVATMCDAKGES